MRHAFSPNEISRVRRNTPPRVLRRIDATIENNIRYYATRPEREISERIEELCKESSIERWLQINASVLGFTTSLLALGKDRRWGLVTCGVLGFFLLHGVQGFDPPLLLLRRKGIRTQGEIDREIYALKTIRGDFSGSGNLLDEGEIHRRDARVSHILQQLESEDFGG